MEQKKDGLAALRESAKPETTNQIAKSAEEATASGDPTTGEKIYQQYTSARISTCMVTPEGKRINFTDYEFYTKDEDVISYLDTELDNGCRAFVKGERVSADDISPAAAAKRKIIEEFKSSQEGRDFSGLGAAKRLAEEGKTGGAGTGAISSDEVAN